MSEVTSHAEVEPIDLSLLMGNSFTGFVDPSSFNLMKTRKNTYRQAFWDPMEADFVAISRRCAIWGLLGYHEMAAIPV